MKSELPLCYECVMSVLQVCYKCVTGVTSVLQVLKGVRCHLSLVTCDVSRVRKLDL